MTDSGSDRNPVELLAEEFVARARRGERPTLSEYAAKYPNLADEIRDLFPALLLMEDLGEHSCGATGPDLGGVVTAERLGDYRILREVGRGGMGVVFEAEQMSLGRRVALKVLPPNTFEDVQKIRRFEREARAAAQLHHTNIVPVYGVGHHAGTHYYVMQFIPGLGLDSVMGEIRQLRSARVSPAPANTVPEARLHASAGQRVARSLVTGQFAGSGPEPTGSAPAPPTDAGPAADSTLPRLPDGSDLSDVSETDLRYWRSVARIGVQVADALAYAHGQGVLHRDIKPSNLLMDMRGTVWITDFGLAKSAGAEDLTHTGDIVGTVRYMAPERFQGRGDARSDVYSLGLTLYELLTLRPAFDGAGRPRLIEQVLHEEPPPLRELNRAVPRDLETVVHKAMAREPERRYASAADLAADLQRLLEDRPIRARRVSGPERAMRWCRRQPALASALGLAGASLLAGMIVSGLFALSQSQANSELAQANRDLGDKQLKLNEEQSHTLQEKNRTDSANVNLRRNLYDADMNLVQAAWELNDTLRFLDLLGRQRPGAGQPDLRGFEWQYWQRLAHAEERSFRLPIEKPIHYFAFSPDGNRLASACSRTVDEESDSRFVQTWETATGAEVVSLVLGPTLGYSSGDQQLCLNRDGSRVSVLQGLGADSTLTTWDVATATRLSRVQFPELARRRSLVFDPDGGHVAITYATGASRKEPGPYVLTVRETATGKEVMSATVPSYLLQFPAFSHDGKRVAAVGSANVSTVLVWDVATGAELARVPTGLCICAALSPDGRLLATGGGPAGSEVVVWDVATRKHIYGLPEPTGAAFHLLFSPDGRKLAAVGATPPTAMVWELDPTDEASFPTPLLKGSGHGKQIHAVGFSGDSRRVYTADGDGTVKVWDTKPPARLFDLRDAVNPSPLTHRLLSPDASRLAVLDPSGPANSGAQISVYDAGGKRLARIDKLSPGLVDIYRSLVRNEVALSAEGRRLATHVSAEGKTVTDLQVFDTDTGESLVTIRENDQCFGVGLSADGRLVAAGLKSPPVKPGPVARPYTGHGFKIWDASTGQLLHAVEAAPRGNPAFSPDGCFLAWVVAPESSREGFEVRVWDTATGQEVASMRKPFNTPVGQLAFSPDGATLAALASGDILSGRQGEVKGWEAATGAPRFSISGTFLQFAFDRSGRRIATCGGTQNASYGQVKLWDTATGRELLRLKTTGRRSQLVFSPDGYRLLAVKDFHNDPGDLVQTWDATPLADAEEQGEGP